MSHGTRRRGRKRQAYAALLLKACGGDVHASLYELKSAATNAAQSQTYEPPKGEVIIRATGVGMAHRLGKAQVNALKNINLAIHKAEFVAITGTNGSGKSTLLELIGWLD